MTSSDGSTVSGTVSVSGSTDSNNYFFYVSATQRGYYTLAINTYYPPSESFLAFKEIGITVNPGSRDHAEVQGSGLAGGNERSTQSFFIRSQDVYDNVISSKGDDYYIAQITSSKGTSYYKAQYTQSGGVRESGWSTDGFALFRKFGTLAASSLSVEEQLIQTYGFFSIQYVVPNIDNEEFTITVGHLSASSVSDGSTGETIWAQSTHVGTWTGKSADTAIASTNVDSFSDNWGLITAAAGGGMVGLALVCYGGWRLQRYRPKYLHQRKRAESAEQQLADMADEVNVIQGNRDFEAVGAATVSANPLHDAYHMKYEPPQEVLLMDGPEGVVKENAPRQVNRKELAPSIVRPLQADLQDDDAY
jgi:hypothetical protein